MVLGDGVAYASQHLSPTVLVDLATLTGAQLITTGIKHAGLVTPHEGLEKKLIEVGKKTGDLLFPMLYAPELLMMKQFASQVADMKNSVSDRMNAPSSGAAHFVEAHLDGEWVKKGGEWAHLDIAGPASLDSRGTGFGVSLLFELAKSLQ